MKNLNYFVFILEEKDGEGNAPVFAKEKAWLPIEENIFADKVKDDFSEVKQPDMTLRVEHQYGDFTVAVWVTPLRTPLEYVQDLAQSYVLQLGGIVQENKPEA